jgi:hypothetical protein
MNYAGYTQETWRHIALDNAAHDYSALVHYATLAASGHNTQPWIFKPEKNQNQKDDRHIRNSSARSYSENWSWTGNASISAAAGGAGNQTRRG